MEDPKDDSGPIPLPSENNINSPPPGTEEDPIKPKYPELEPPGANIEAAKEPEMKEKEKKPEAKKPEAPEYDDDAVPPNFELAKIHGRARRVYVDILEGRKPKDAKVCGCCGNMYDLEKLRVCCDRSDMYHLGIGFPLYFEFIIFSCILLVIIFLIGGIYDFVTNMIKDDCTFNWFLIRDDRQFCDLNRITRMSLLNKRFEKYLLEIGNWLNFAIIIVMLIAFQIFKRQSRLTSREVDNSKQTPSDFTIVISNMPRDATDEEIKAFFDQQLFSDRKTQISNIVRGYDITEYVKLTRRKDELQDLIPSPKQVNNKQKLEAELEDVKKKLDTLEKNANKSLEYSSYVYITFETEKYAKEALDRLGFKSLIRAFFYHIGCYKCFKDTRFRKTVKLIAHRAPEPSDILWENLGTPASVKNKRRLVSLFVSILMILACFGIITGFNTLKALASKSSDANNRQIATTVGLEILSIIIAVLILIVNSVLNIVTRKFAAYESHSTYTDYFVSVARRLAIFTFINSAFTILITCYAIKNLWKEGGLVNQAFVNFIVTAIVTPLSSIFDPFYYLRLYQRSEALKKGKECTLTQKEANQLFEGPAIDMALCYANVLKAVWIGAFYAPLLPVGLPITVVGLILNYWVNKYLLLRRYAKPLELGKGLSTWMAEYLEFTPFFFAMGNIVFRKLIVIEGVDYPEPPKLAAVLAIAIGAGSIFIPFDTIFTCFKAPEDSFEHRKTYSEKRIDFNNDYAISNPIYHDAALDEWLKIVKQVDKGKHDAIQEMIQHPEDNNRSSWEKARKVNMFTNLQNYAHQAKGLQGVQNAHGQAVMVQNPAQIFHGVHPVQLQAPVNLNTFGTAGYPYQPVQQTNPSYNQQASFYGGTNATFRPMNTNNVNNPDPYGGILIQNKPIQPRGNTLPPIQRQPNTINNNPYNPGPQPMNTMNNAPHYPNMSQFNGYPNNFQQSVQVPINQNLNQGYPQNYGMNQGSMMMPNNGYANNGYQDGNILQRNKPQSGAPNFVPQNYNNPNVNINFSQNFGAPPGGYGGYQG